MFRCVRILAEFYARDYEAYIGLRVFSWGQSSELSIRAAFRSRILFNSSILSLLWLAFFKNFRQKLQTFSKSKNIFDLLFFYLTRPIEVVLNTLRVRLHTLSSRKG